MRMRMPQRAIKCCVAWRDSEFRKRIPIEDNNEKSICRNNVANTQGETKFGADARTLRKRLELLRTKLALDLNMFRRVIKLKRIRNQ
jgi:hypothetical protein